MVEIPTNYATYPDWIWSNFCGRLNALKIFDQPEEQTAPTIN